MALQRRALLTAALAAMVVLVDVYAVQARCKKVGELGIQRNSNGVPIIMKGFRSDRGKTRRAGTAPPATRASRQLAIRSACIPRSSSTPIARSTATTTGQSVQPYNPPKITTP